jgi:hypothetical protein
MAAARFQFLHALENVPPMTSLPLDRVDADDGGIASARHRLGPAQG